MSAPEQVTYRDGETGLTGSLFRPAHAPRAAVLVFPTIMNPTPAVATKAQALADAGYLALVADFYGQQPANMDEARQLALALRETPESYRQRLRAAVRALALQDKASSLPLLCIGLLDTELPAEPGKVRARILVCHGDADPMVPRSAVTRFWEEMDHAGADWHFHSYGGVRHGFTNPHPVTNPATAYDASADRQSWAAMHALFDEVLEADA